MMGVAPLLPLRSRFLKHSGETIPDEPPAVGFSDSLPGADEQKDKGIRMEAKPSEAKPTEAKPKEAKPSEAKPLEALHEVDEQGDDGIREDGGVMPGLAGALRMCGIGLGSGFLAGVFGVGGGVVTVPAISLATDLSHKEVGTSVRVHAARCERGN